MPHNYRIGISRVRKIEIVKQRLNLGLIDAWNMDAWNVIFSNIEDKPRFLSLNSQSTITHKVIITDKYAAKNQISLFREKYATSWWASRRAVFRPK